MVLNPQERKLLQSVFGINLNEQALFRILANKNITTNYSKEPPVAVTSFKSIAATQNRQFCGF